MGFSDSPSPDNWDTHNHHLHGALGFTISIGGVVLLTNGMAIVMDTYSI